ncbi:MAG: efflux RND transporter permease subunit [Candidatus Midichloria sp.]|nr:efflux RND transporter permease subunit [Candidatus Midichloria sp.]
MLLALVLAIGLVVDDAIVVLENIQRYYVAMTLTLASKYIYPCGFFLHYRGAIGELFIVYVPAISSNDISSSVEKEIKSIPEAPSNMY